MHPSEVRYAERRLHAALPRWERAAVLRKQGLKFYEIGARLGISASSAASLVNKFDSFQIKKREAEILKKFQPK
jgi:hypothetical protein